MAAASEPAPPAPQAPAPSSAQVEPSRPRRQLSSKGVKVLVIVAVVAVVVVILLWGMVPARILDAGQVTNNAAGYMGKTIYVKGTVVDWTSGSHAFKLADPAHNSTTLAVRYGGAYPSGFALNASAIVKGTLRTDGSVTYLDATEIQIGCPSKY